MLKNNYIAQFIFSAKFRLSYHIIKYYPFYVFFGTILAVIIYKLNFDPEYITYAADPQNEGQSSESNVEQMGNTNRVLEEVAITYGQDVADKLFEDEDLLQEMDKLSEKDAMTLAEKYIEDNNIKGSN
jgi:hypothetical protein